MEPQKTQNCQSKTEEKEQSWRHNPPGFRQYYKATVSKMWHIYTMEYYSAIKRNEIELFVVRWMDLETDIQSEVSQKEKNKYRMLTYIYIWNLKNKTNNKTETDS